MNTRKFILGLLASLIFIVNGFGQTLVSGRVTEVIDGRTLIIDAGGETRKISIAFIEVPQEDQPLFAVIRDHLRKLVQGQRVEFVTVESANIGKVFTGGIDLAQQLIRDGAAWHLPRESTRQEAAEAVVYARHQELAKSEKRGIWSLENLQIPSMTSSTAKKSNSSKTAGKRNYSDPISSEDMWIDVGGESLTRSAASKEIHHGYDADKRMQNMSTNGSRVLLSDGTSEIEAELRVFFFRSEIVGKQPHSAYILGLLVESGSHRFEANNRLSFFVNGETINLGTGQVFWRETENSVEELAQYRISQAALTKIVNAENVELKVGTFRGSLSVGAREILAKLVERSL